LIPAAKLSSELKADFKKLNKSIHNFYARLELDNTFKQNNPFIGFETETATNAYSLLNMGLGADIVKEKKTLFSFHVAIINITDVAWQSHLSRLKYAAENLQTGRTGVFNAGRNFSFKINVPLDFSTK
jgi:iron complex outermembrane receptor protein